LCISAFKHPDTFGTMPNAKRIDETSSLKERHSNPKPKKTKAITSNGWGDGGIKP
jgi:hypothetical protein